MNDYYKAYEMRYKQVHSKNQLWASTDNTSEIIKTINKYNIVQSDKILEIGCGEGRDAIYLLNNNYNVDAFDYSITAINKCNELTKNKYKEKFRQFDIIKDNLNKKYDFIYSVAVLHMFVENTHRNKYFNFINNHLTDKGKALIIVMGDGNKKYESNTKEAFINKKRININNDEEMFIAATSCKIVNWKQLEAEVINNNLCIIDKWISKDIPDFSECMCCLVEKNNKVRKV